MSEHARIDVKEARPLASKEERQWATEMTSVFKDIQKSGVCGDKTKF
jgi:hypothetical protein